MRKKSNETKKKQAEKKERKLSITRDTLREVSTDDLQAVAGGRSCGCWHNFEK